MILAELDVGGCHSWDAVFGAFSSFFKLSCNGFELLILLLLYSQQLLLFV